jgi:hypothetical protein
MAGIRQEGFVTHREFRRCRLFQPAETLRPQLNRDTLFPLPRVFCPNEMPFPSFQMRTSLASGDALEFSLDCVAGRWIEKVSLFPGPEGEVIALESVTYGEDRWPSSPPWQDAVHETHCDQNVLMAIGRAGRSHWSGSWRIATGPLAGGIEAEIACRIHELPEFLGTTYRIVGRPAIVSLAVDRFIVGGENATITFLADPQTARIELVSESVFSIRPAWAESARFPETVSYGFRIFARRHD